MQAGRMSQYDWTSTGLTFSTKTTATVIVRSADRTGSQSACLMVVHQACEGNLPSVGADTHRVASCIAQQHTVSITT